MISAIRTMPIRERPAFTLPPEMLGAIDRLGADRLRFVLDAVRHELERRKHELAAGIILGRAPVEDELSCLVDLKSGTPVRWVPGRGWVEVPG